MWMGSYRLVNKIKSNKLAAWITGQMIVVDGGMSIVA